jgi:transketolase
VVDALDEAEMVRDRGSVIVSHTVKGKGVSWMELNPDWHGKAPDEQQAEIAIAEIRGEIDAAESTKRYEALEGSK